MNQADALRVLALREIESAQPPVPALWTPADRDWASRAALDQAGPPANAQRFLVERARLALQRLDSRVPELKAWLERCDGTGGRRAGGVGWPGWPWALAGAFIAGLAIDSLGGARHINLLAPPLWGVMAWNLLVYALLIVRLPRGRDAPPGWLSRRVTALFRAAWLASPASLAVPALRTSPAGPAPHSRPIAPTGHATVLRSIAATWAHAAAPHQRARAVALLHALAAALALGLIGGLYLRGLVFDYRAGWQSTFLDAASVHAVLSFVLAPAVQLTRIAVPDAGAFEALRLGATPAEASAAPWIHLLATSLALLVVVPRLGLSLAGSWRARRLAAAVELPLHEPYFQRLLREQRGEVAVVHVVPYAQAPGAPASAALAALLAQALGSQAQVLTRAPVEFGAEDDAAPASLVPPGTTHALLLFDLAATPEAEHHGRIATRLATEAAARGATALLCVDEAGFVRRFAPFAQRMAERRAAWQALAASAGVPLVVLALDPAHSDPTGSAPGTATLQAALDAAAGARTAANPAANPASNPASTQ